MTDAPSASSSPSAPAAIRWYHSPVSREDLRDLLRRDNRLAWAQTLGYLLLIVLTGGAVLAAGFAGLWWAVPLLLLVHGTCTHFLINAVHELGHETVFSNRSLNRFFAAIFAFPGWINHLHFDASHSRHHRYTLHQPDDLEVVVPIRLTLTDFLRIAVFDAKHPWEEFSKALRYARGGFIGPWNATIFPADKPGDRAPVVRWARFLVVGHLLILAASAALAWFHHPAWLLLPLVVSFPNMWGGWLQWLCNNPQHAGMEDRVPDARRCCRTILLNPALQFLYWHMNYHIEHHMFAAVPCYHLGRLHRLIRSDLPACPVGLVATWREILAIQRRQQADPLWRPAVVLPAATT